MTTEAFIERKFSAGSIAIIKTANAIIREYQAEGLTLTLRQLYYQFVSRDIIANKQTEYKRLGSIINDARLAGYIDWSAIEDRTRNVRKLSTWSTPADIIDSAAYSYREDLWRTQDNRVEVWIEKDALIGVVEAVCEEHRVPFFACRGYTSQSEQYAAGKRFEQLIDDDIQPIVLHLGDHDPSGIDMTRDNDDRLRMFARAGVDVRRLALNMDQVKRYNPPPNPAKETDSRAGDYMRKFGNSSWELDALDPKVIVNLIRSELDTIIDRDAWGDAQAEETENKKVLKKCSAQWPQVVKFLAKKGAGE